jgi:hypothetical protein
MRHRSPVLSPEYLVLVRSKAGSKAEQRSLLPAKVRNKNQFYREAQISLIRISDLPENKKRAMRKTTSRAVF